MLIDTAPRTAASGEIIKADMRTLGLDGVSETSVCTLPFTKHGALATAHALLQAVAKLDDQPEAEVVKLTA